MELYSMDGIKATCNIYFCDYGTVLVENYQQILFQAKHLFNRAADIAQFDLVNSRIFKDLRNEIQGLSSICPVFKYFQGLEFRRKKIRVLSSTFEDAWEPCQPAAQPYEQNDL